MSALTTDPDTDQRPAPWVTAPRLAALTGAVAVVVAAVAVTFTGATKPLVLGDPGALTRWGLPLLATVRDLATVLTTGSLLLGGLLMPEAARTQRRRRTGRIAAWSALVWSLAGAVWVVLQYAAVAGLPVGARGFWSSVWSMTWQLDLLRAPAISAIIAAGICLWCLAFPSRDGQAWGFGFTLIGLWPMGLIGHAAGSNDHQAAVDSLYVHLAGASIWVGGLIALAIVWSSLGRRAADVVARYSAIALWCYVAVGLSGVLAAIIRVGDWSALTSRYGLVVLAKAACLLALGILGYRQRTLVVQRLRTQPTDIPPKRLFGRLAIIEIVVMATAFGLGAALAVSQTPVPQTIEKADPALSLTGYPTPPPISPARVLFSWSTEYLMTGLALVGIGVYLMWVARLHRRGDRWPWTRTVSWVVGWLAFIYVIDGGVAVYGRVMFSAHMAQHMLLSMFVPLLLVRGGAVTLALRALPHRTDQTLGPRELLLAAVHSRVMQIVANPVVIAIIQFGTLILFYYTPWFELSLRTHTGHLLMIVHFMLSGYLFAWAMVGIDPGPPKWSPPMRLLILLIAVCFHAFFGVALMSGTALLGGDFFPLLRLPWLSSPLVDQQRGGTVAWGAGELPTLVIALLIAAEWYRKDTSEARRRERQADRDGDAELQAYNDYLAARAAGNRQKD